MYSDILVDGRSQTWMLMVSSNVSPVTATVNTLRYQIYAISAVMLCFAVLIALTLSRRIIRPIVRLNTAAGELARGNYDATFQADGYREIGQLADTLSHAATELGKTETLRRELIANVSHDLRTPLTLITGYSEMVRDIPGENTPENMQVIIDESKRLTSLVNDLLDLSKLQASMTAPDFQRFNITDSVREILARLARFTEKDGYTLCLEAEEDVCVLADKGRLTQVIYNLLTNAVNYTGEDKVVTVRQLTEGDRVTIQIIDTGEGIDPENLPYVWDRYFKVDKVHKRAVTGSGLGLSIVKNILTQHPGVEYGVESEVGKGSNFWFSMPLAAPEETEIPALPEES
jgi:signal transduction histidine kinase